MVWCSRSASNESNGMMDRDLANVGRSINIFIDVGLDDTMFSLIAKVYFDG